MSIRLETDSLQDSESELRCHHMPCEIDFNGEAKVDEYFVSSIREDKETDDNSPSLTSSFRGRPLNGTKVNLPQGYIGLVMKETIKDEDERREFQIRGKFSNFTNWNLDLTPSSSDNINKALDWIDVANLLHEPIEKTPDIKEENQ